MNQSLARIEMPDLTRVSGEDQQICMMFNRAARDVRQDDNVIRNAFDITLTRLGHKYDEDRIMHALMKGGFQAPSHMMPEKYAIYGSDVADGKARTAEHFHGALTGAQAHPADPPVFDLPERLQRPQGQVFELPEGADATRFHAAHLDRLMEPVQTPPAYMLPERRANHSGLAHLTHDM